MSGITGVGVSISSALIMHKGFDMYRKTWGQKVIV